MISHGPRYVRVRRQRQREMFVPLRHDPGHAQVDFGEALAVIAGDARKIHFFAMDLPHSDGCVVQACPSDSSEARQRADLIDFMRESPHARLIGGPRRIAMITTFSL